MFDVLVKEEDFNFAQEEFHFLSYRRQKID